MENKLKLATIFAIIGFLVTTRWWITMVNDHSPLKGIVFYYILITITVYILERLGLVINGVEFTDLRHAIGSAMILFSYFIVIRWQSCYMNMVIDDNCDVNNIYLHSEDGATYYLWSKFIKDPRIIRILTYVVTPFILTLVGGMLVTQKVKLGF